LLLHTKNIQCKQKMETTKHRSALIIDDEYDICFLLSRILRNSNLAVRFVNSLDEGKEMLATIIPDILFLDNHLSDGFGIDFISYVKEKYPAIKVIMVTAHDTSEDRQMALQKGADVFISKPFSAAQIKDAIAKIMIN
jgi:two-component system, OmpR family, response regulator